MAESAKCPSCARQATSKPFKKWRFGRYDVSRYECPSCKTKFNVYRSQGRTFTIPKPAG